jgi:5-methylcytosine-specific restriction endonuclease McrA
MANRKSVSKKVRFEVFKRDKFICQYCGRHAPNIILEIDHIEPVSKGGTNDILNLITSCKECNRGKTNVQLDDESALAKQKKQLEELQERREQIELLLQWRKSLSTLENDTVNLVVDYINSKIEDFSLNEVGMRGIEKLTKRFDLPDILEAIDISRVKYLQYDSDNKLTKDSVEQFISKIGGILVLKNKPEIDQELAYVKGICRNRFNYWDNKVGSIILSNYVSALREYGWDEERILDDIRTEVKPKTLECKNWTQWRKLVEGWTADIQKWETQEYAELGSYDISELKEIAQDLLRTKSHILPALKHTGSVFENYTPESLEQGLTHSLIHYLTSVTETDNSDENQNSSKPSIMSSFWKSGLGEVFKPINSHLTYYLAEAALELYRLWLESYEIFLDDQLTPENAQIILNEFAELGGENTG